MTVEVFAPAKVNLTLHVTGRRADGYHLLDSLVAFPPIGDVIRVAEAKETSFAVTGPFAHAIPSGADNLVLRAAALMDATAAITLEKNLPPASGIGGGSADAAATVRALAALHGLPAPGSDALLKLGADVPVCMAAGTVRMRGIGEIVEPVFPPLEWPLVLVNPGVEVPTAEVFRRLARADNPPMADELYDPAFFEFPEWLGRQRNDLEAPAREIAPVIGEVLDAILAETGCRFARMSGSGATCYGLFDTAEDAAEAARLIAGAHPGWWVTSS